MLLIGVGVGAYVWKKSYVATCTTDCNVILISVDSLRADHMSSYGYKRKTTPNFDALAQQGTLFKNYYSPSFITPVVEASVQTGLYPTSHGVTNFVSLLPKERTILPEYLKRLGFQTEAIISSPEFVYYSPIKDSFKRGYDKYNFPRVTDGPGSPARRYPPIKIFKEAFVSSKKSDKQSFLWLALGGVHWPFGWGEPNQFGATNYNGPLAGKQLDWPVFKNIYNGVLYPGSATENTDKIQLTNNDIQYVRDNYDNGVYAFDQFLGQVMNELKKNKLDKKTIIVVESEHGEELGEHGYFAHYDIWDTQTHQPLLIVDPRVKGGAKISSIVGSVDILPTILNLVGTTSTNGLQGKSLAPLIRKTEPDGQRKTIFQERVPLWEEAVLQTRHDMGQKGFQLETSGAKDIAIRTDKWKYILRLSSKKQAEISWWKFMSGQPILFPEVELYDLAKDPGETKNVVAEHPEVANQLNKELRAWYKKVQSNSSDKVKKTELVQPYL